MMKGFHDICTGLVSRLLLLALMVSAVTPSIAGQGRVLCFGSDGRAVVEHEFLGQCAEWMQATGIDTLQASRGPYLETSSHADDCTDVAVVEVRSSRSSPQPDPVAVPPPFSRFSWQALNDRPAQVTTHRTGLPIARDDAVPVEAATTRRSVVLQI